MISPRPHSIATSEKMHTIAVDTARKRENAHLAPVTQPQPFSTKTPLWLQLAIPIVPMKLEK